MFYKIEPWELNSFYKYSIIKDKQKIDEILYFILQEEKYTLEQIHEFIITNYNLMIKEANKKYQKKEIRSNFVELCSYTYSKKVALDKKLNFKVLTNSEYSYGADSYIFDDDKNLICVIECKAYGDIDMLSKFIGRTFLLLERDKISYNNIFILEMEKSVSDSKFDDLFKNTKKNYKKLTLLEGKRNSLKPFWKKEFKKELTTQALDNLYCNLYLLMNY